VNVRRQFVAVPAGLEPGPPKSRAGLRVVSFPTAILPELRKHLDRFSGEEPSGLVFPNEHGAPLWRGNINKAVAWAEICERLGIPGLHLHYLRHTGNTPAAQSGASLRDLMARMGHDCPAAALIYHHSRRASDQAIAAALDAQLTARLRVDETQSHDGSGALCGAHPGRDRSPRSRLTAAD
jgi:integrase